MKILLADLLTTEEVAQKLRVSPSTLRLWRKIGKGPKVIQVGPGTYRYQEHAIEEHITGNVVKSDFAYLFSP